jgi:hypothetical protein
MELQMNFLLATGMREKGVFTVAASGGVEMRCEKEWRRNNEGGGHDQNEFGKADELQHDVQSKTVRSEMQPKRVCCIYGALLVS